MTSLQRWLTKPRATVRIDTSVPWPARTWPSWMRALRRSFAGRQPENRVRIEVVDRLSLGGKKSLLLVEIEGRRLLVGVGEDTAPSISTFDDVRSVSPMHLPSRSARALSRRRMVRG